MIEYKNITVDDYNLLHDTTGYHCVKLSNVVYYVSSGSFHRTDGPAIMYTNGHIRWAVNGEHYCSNKEYQEAANLSDEDMAILVLKYGNISL